jgi:hypothetical protein
MIDSIDGIRSDAFHMAEQELLQSAEKKEILYIKRLSQNTPGCY